MSSKLYKECKQGPRHVAPLCDVTSVLRMALWPALSCHLALFAKSDHIWIKGRSWRTLRPILSQPQTLMVSHSKPGLSVHLYLQTAVPARGDRLQAPASFDWFLAKKRRKHISPTPLQPLTTSAEDLTSRPPSPVELRGVHPSAAGPCGTRFDFTSEVGSHTVPQCVRPRMAFTFHA